MADTKIYIVQPTSAHTHTIIFLHGRGSSASEFASEFFESQDSQGRYFAQIFPGVKWVFPCATLPYLDEPDCFQWFDMASVERPNENDEIQGLGLHDSVQRLLQNIENEQKEVAMSKIFVAGISQGCATAIFTLIYSGLRLGGFIGLSGWLPFHDQIKTILNMDPKLITKVNNFNESLDEIRKLIGPINDPDLCIDSGVTTTPMLLQHCNNDNVVPVRNGNLLKWELRKMGANVEWTCFEDGGHWLNEPKGVDKMVQFIETCMEKI